MSKPRGKPASKTTTIARQASPDLRRILSPATAARAAVPALWIGTSGWHYTAWRGSFYPSDLKPKDFLSFYLEQFNTTEINNSFYRLPTEAAVRAWRESVPEGFLFAWKASRFITHLKRLKDVEESLDLVFGRMASLGPACGPALFQLPPTLRAEPENRERLVRCLDRVAGAHRCAFEFRHPSWYDERVFDLLRGHNAALCVSDHAAAPAPWVATADFAYVRGHGSSGRYEGHYGAGTLRDWADRLLAWRDGKRDLYVYFDNDVKGAAPVDAKALVRMMAERGRFNRR